ncbi:MAG: retropepsin-like aspartic protease [Candidatus Omnitrophota bacterium]|nr:retropepsin-like aspartic protease [Candidatus Omnitrophota bacterium]
MKQLFIFSLFFIFGFLFQAQADIVYLKNGRNIEGIVKENQKGQVEVEISIGIVKFNKNEVEKIEKGSLAEEKALRQKWERQKQAAEARRLKVEEEAQKKPKKVEFKTESGDIIADCLLNNKVKARLLLDTGASSILLRKSVAQQLFKDGFMSLVPDSKSQLADGRVVNAKRLLIDKIKVQDVEASNVDAHVLIDEMGTKEMYDGLLGMSFLKRFKFTIDQKERKLILEKQ